MGSGRTMKRGARRVFASRRRICICILHWEVGQAGARNGLHHLCFSGLEICRVSNVWLVERLFTLTSVFSSASLASSWDLNTTAPWPRWKVPAWGCYMSDCQWTVLLSIRRVGDSQGPTIPLVFNISSHETEPARQDTHVSALGAGLHSRVCSRLPRCTRTFESL
jgi:hypothetical protein